MNNLNTTGTVNTKRFSAPTLTAHELNTRKALINTMGTNATNNNLASALRLTWVKASGELTSRTILSEGKVKSRLKGGVSTSKDIPHLFTCFDLNVAAKISKEEVETAGQALMEKLHPEVEAWAAGDLHSQLLIECMQQAEKDSKKGDYRAVDLRTLVSARCGTTVINFQNTFDEALNHIDHIIMDTHEDAILWCSVNEDKRGNTPILLKSTTGRKMKWSSRAKQTREAILAEVSPCIFKLKNTEYYHE